MERGTIPMDFVLDQGCQDKGLVWEISDYVDSLRLENIYVNLP